MHQKNLKKKAAATVKITVGSEVKAVGSKGGVTVATDKSLGKVEVTNKGDVKTSVTPEKTASVQAEYRNVQAGVSINSSGDKTVSAGVGSSQQFAGKFVEVNSSITLSGTWNANNSFSADFTAQMGMAFNFSGCQNVKASGEVSILETAKGVIQTFQESVQEIYRSFFVQTGIPMF